MSETGHAALLEIVESLPAHPTSGQLLGALVRAERAGFERGLRAKRIEQTQERLRALETPSPFLSRQAD